MRAKTDRTNAETIARFMAFLPDAGCCLQHEKLCLLKSSAAERMQLVDARKRHSMHRKARGKHGTAEEFESLDYELVDLLT